MRVWQLSIVALLTRTPAFWRRVLPLTIGTVIATVSLGLLAAAQLAPLQQVESRLGSADGAVSAGKAVPAGSAAPALESRPHVISITTELTSFIELANPRISGTLYIETDWVSPAVAGRVELVSGRWPTQPGEVVVSKTVPLTPGSTSTTVVGPNTMDVVGVAHLVYSAATPAVMAAPGTWAAWPVTRRQAEQAGLTANRQLLFTATDPARVCSQLLADHTLAGDGLNCETRAGMYQLSATGNPVRFLLEQGLPALGIQLLAAVLAGGLVTRLLQRMMRPLSDVGLPSRSLRLAGLVQASVGSAAAIAAGLALGFGVTLLARPLVAAQLNHPLSPIAAPVSAALGGLAALLVVLVAVRPLPPSRERRPHALSERAADRLAAVGCSLIALSIAGTVQLPQALSTVALVAVGTSVGFALLAPRLVLLASAADFVPSVRLAAARALGSNSRTYAIHVALTATLVGLICSSLALASGLVANLNQNSGTGIPAGMVLLNVDEDGRLKLTDQVVREFEKSLGLGDPITVWQGVDQAGTGELTPWWAFPSINDAQHVFPGLSEGQVHALAAAGSVSLRPDSQTGHLQRPRDLRWLLELRISSSRPSTAYATSLLYLGLTPEQDELAAAWADDHGLAPGYVRATDAAADVPIPLLTAIGASAFAVSTGLMSSVAMRGELAALRGLLAAFNALGLGRRWCFGVIVTISLALSGLAVILGWCSALVTAALVRFLLDDALLLGGVHWLVLAAVGLGTVAGGALGGALSSYRFAAQEVNGR